MMYRKFFACSFDDGLEQDRRIIETLKEFKMGGTFHLSSGLFGKKVILSASGIWGWMPQIYLTQASLICFRTWIIRASVWNKCVRFTKGSRIIGTGF